MTCDEAQNYLVGATREFIINNDDYNKIKSTRKIM